MNIAMTFHSSNLINNDTQHHTLHFYTKKQNHIRNYKHFLSNIFVMFTFMFMMSPVSSSTSYHDDDMITPREMLNIDQTGNDKGYS